MFKSVLKFSANFLLLLLLLGIFSLPVFVSYKTLQHTNQSAVLSFKTKQDLKLQSQVSDYGDLLKEEILTDGRIKIFYKTFPGLLVDYEKIYLVENVSKRNILLKIEIIENNFGAELSWDEDQKEIQLEPNQAVFLNLRSSSPNGSGRDEQVIFKIFAR